MSPPAVAKHLNIINNSPPGLLTGSFSYSKKLLTLEGPEKALNHSIIPAISPSTHTAAQAMRAEKGFVHLMIDPFPSSEKTIMDAEFAGSLCYFAAPFSNHSDGHIPEFNRGVSTCCLCEHLLRAL